MTAGTLAARPTLTAAEWAAWYAGRDNPLDRPGQLELLVRDEVWQGDPADCYVPCARWGRHGWTEDCWLC